MSGSLNSEGGNTNYLYTPRNISRGNELSIVDSTCSDEPGQKQGSFHSKSDLSDEYLEDDSSTLLSSDPGQALQPHPQGSDFSQHNNPLTRNTHGRGRMGQLWDSFWQKNKGVSLVVISQFFGAIMSVLTRLLETEGANGTGMHPLQILCARMSITSILCFAYMYFNKVPYAPFGKREVRGLLVARGVGGFFGVTGLYYSLVYLPIAEATVLSFLAPMVAGFACSFLINEPFPRLEQIAALFSIGGVGLIAVDSPSPESAKNGTANIASRAQSSDVSSSHRLGAICMAMVGVLGAASAYTTIRWIGKRAHPLISVNYFAVWCTIVSTTALLAVPDIGFKLPSNAIEWTYFVGMGISGFVMQFLLTAGLQFEKSSRANNMVYTLMFFALAADKVIWGTTPSLVSVTGSGLILGSAVYVAVKKDAPKTGKNREQRGDDEEEAAFLVQNSEDQEQTEVLELHSAAVRQSEPQRP